MTSTSRRLLRAACAVGLVHAAFSLYWALGGRWLLDTVGQWAVDWARTAPVTAGAALVLVAAVKVGAAAVPLLVEAGRLPGRRWWRAISAGGAGVLIVYGLLNTVVAWLVLGGAVSPGSGYDRAAMLGHAALWDPLFLLWGLLLGAGLGLCRPGCDASAPQTAQDATPRRPKPRRMRRLDAANRAGCDASAGGQVLRAGETR